MSPQRASETFWRGGEVLLADPFSDAEPAPISDEVDRVIRREATYLPAADLIYEPHYGTPPPCLPATSPWR